MKMKDDRFQIIYNHSKDNYLFLDFKNREELSHSQVFSLLNTWDKILTDLESVFNKEIYTCGDLFDPDAPVEIKTRTFHDIFHIQQVEIERLNIELEVYKSSYGKFKEKVDEYEEYFRLIKDLHTYRDVDTFKTLLECNIEGVDSVAECSAGAWEEYNVLQGLYEKLYGERYVF